MVDPLRLMRTGGSLALDSADLTQIDWATILRVSVTGPVNRAKHDASRHRTNPQDPSSAPQSPPAPKETIGQTLNPFLEDWQLLRGRPRAEDVRQGELGAP